MNSTIDRLAEATGYFLADAEASACTSHEQASQSVTRTYDEARARREAGDMLACATLRGRAQRWSERAEQLAAYRNPNYLPVSMRETFRALVTNPPALVAA